MKKIISLLLALVCLVALVGCNSNNEKTVFLCIDQQGELCDGYVEKAAKITVQFKSTEGPYEISIEVWFKSNDDKDFMISGETGTVKIGETISFDVPQNSAYMVKTTATSGNDGNVVFFVSQEGV